MIDAHPQRGQGAVLTAPTRHRLARVTRWHAGTREVPLDRLLLGGQNGMTAAQFATVYGDPLWPSRQIADSPHVELLDRADLGPLSDQDILESSYGRMAMACIRHTGRYFAAADHAGILAQARQFIEYAATGGRGPAVTGDHHSAPGMPVLTVPIADSDCHQLLDGHHRVAQLVREGVSTVRVRVRRGHVDTPLQQLLRRMSWLDGGRELYQPVSSPELEAQWPTVRRCTDRLDLMTSFLADRGLDAPGTSYLDVASCYGWFVDQMGIRGYAAEGLERDPLGAELGRVVYDLDPTRIRIGDAEQILATTSRRWDVVSCFSLLHHFVLGRGGCSAVELARRLDASTRRVLFLDTGQEHERWFRTSLGGWDTGHVEAFLRQHTTFDEVIDLGPDQDAVAPYEDNYGRHLFACIRTS
ncbi:hypothetical protein ASE01_00390 [Nocardioides sp. Root190]|uniref:hypothetical protein n=1 Tax=Nocardioides sp. Root190 TaxID=1736488 RepID=UPI0006FDF5D4|nr:hypothetical protein [Nocardioides sp. Root190]KRB80005.1 hypothetical protein ASE01_00390 [Nocardioides sp. Root190]